MKYYAVKKGRQLGIYNTWEEAKSSVDGYYGAQHKSFKSLQEAQQYLDFSSNHCSSIPDDASHIKMRRAIPVQKVKSNEIHPEPDCCEIEIYVDGACKDNQYSSQQTCRTGWGVVALKKIYSMY